MYTAKNRNKKVLILSSLSFALSLLLFLSGALNVFELKAFDAFSKYLNPKRSFSDIVIVEVDQQSIDALGREGVNWPWPRQMYSAMIDHMSMSEAVFIDILFSEPSSYGNSDDIMLSNSINNASNVYLPVFLTKNIREFTEKDKAFIQNIALKQRVQNAISYDYAVTPIDELKSVAKGGGNVTTLPDEDGVYRRIPVASEFRGYFIPSLVLGYMTYKQYASIENNCLYVGNDKIIETGGKILLRYYRGDNQFIRIPAANILSSYRDTQRSKEPLYSREFFQGKKIFIGLTAGGLYDLKPTSVSSVSTGVFIHATMLANLKNRDYIMPLNDLYLIFFMLLLCIFITYIVIRFYSVHINLSVFLLSSVVTLLVPAILFKYALYMKIIPSLLSLITGFIVSASYSYAVEGRERRFNKKVFSQYMDKTLAEYILSNPHLMKPGGELKKVTVFFADMAGFTAIAEKVSANETANMLCSVFNEFTEVIIKNKGVVDKYIGDCVMAFWGAPYSTSDDVKNACYAALQCIEALEGINSRFREKGLTEVSMRIGIHTGEAIAGNIGSDRLFNYTVVGDTVNLASRLEATNKIFGTKIIISEETMKAAGGLFITRELGNVEVKGKTAPVRIFELVGPRLTDAPDAITIKEK